MPLLSLQHTLACMWVSNDLRYVGSSLQETDSERQANVQLKRTVTGFPRRRFESDYRGQQEEQEVAIVRLTQGRSRMSNHQVQPAKCCRRAVGWQGAITTVALAVNVREAYPDDQREFANCPQKSSSVSLWKASSASSHQSRGKGHQTPMLREARGLNFRRGGALD